MIFETPPPVLLVTDIVFFDHISARELPSANQLPPGGPAINLSCAGHPAFGVGAAAAGAEVTANRETKSKNTANFFM
ncbi:hypothetical protein SDC9_141887 [bioreactor metagenome]|uniref:Uncharacterized protein n=1 Tax=bioreactor metagenome TaxID=1076179 RepID=A0A645DZP9_9ZZZZ